MDGLVEIVDLRHMTTLARVSLPGMPVDVISSGDGQAFVSTMVVGDRRKGLVAALSITTGAVTALAETGASWAKGLALRPGTAELWVAGWYSGSVTILHTETLRVHDIIPCGTALRGIAFAPDGAVAYVTDYYGRNVVHIDAGSRAITHHTLMPYRGLAYKGTPRDILVGAGGELTVSNMGRGSIHRVPAPSDDTRPGVSRTARIGLRPATLRFAPGGGAIVCACHGSGDIWWLNAETLDVQRRVPLSGRAYGIDFTSDGSLVAALFDEGRLELLEFGPNGAAQETS